MPRKILVVDDSATERYVVEQILTRAGFTVISAGSGEEGVNMTKTEKPDLVVMDVVMPGLNGFQATREISKSPDTASIPVIMCTSRNSETDSMWGKRQGAVEYLTKPVNEKALLAAIAKILK